MPFVLAERARSECARSTRAVKGNLATPSRERVDEKDARSRGNRHPPPLKKSE